MIPVSEFQRGSPDIGKAAQDSILKFLFDVHSRKKRHRKRTEAIGTTANVYIYIFGRGFRAFRVIWGAVGVGVLFLSSVVTPCSFGLRVRGSSLRGQAGPGLGLM